jgi:DNA-directed RNA polymerase
VKAEEYGVTDFALIHDSFGTLAADTDAMFSAVRDAFVEMYTAHDPFQHLYEQVYESLSEEGREKLPRPPPRAIWTCLKCSSRCTHLPTQSQDHMLR